jgi:hypothetical protein
MDLSFLNNSAISFGSDNEQWLYQIPTAIIALGALILSGFTFVRTRMKMNKSEQIKMVHEIQMMYLDLFDRYKNTIKEFNHEESNQYVVTSYIGLFDPLEWYAYLREKNQVSEEFDMIFNTYFKAVHLRFENNKQHLKPDSYPRVKSYWRKLGLLC